MPRKQSRNPAVRSRKSSRLRLSLDKNLSSYALAASVAGAGVLALTSPAEGKVVFTPTHQLLGPFARLNLDLNHDGVNDFFFSNFNFATHVSYPGSYGSVEITGSATGNQVVLSSRRAFAQALDSGVEVSSKASFHGGRENMNFCRTNPSHHIRFRSGPWINVKSKYVGLRFLINGQTHYGWARFNMRQANYCETFATLTGYAYETVANQPIKTGKPQTDSVGLLTFPELNFPATLGALAQGSATLTVWRKEENWPRPF